MPQPSRRFTALVLPSPLNRSASDCCLLSSVHSFFSCYLFCYFCDRIIIPAAKVIIFLQTAKEFTGNFPFFSSDSPSGNPSCMVFWGTGTRKNGGATISNYLHNSPIKRHTSGWQEESLPLKGRIELSSSICQHCVGRLSKRGSAAWSESHSLLCDDGDDGDGANDYQTYSLF